MILARKISVAAAAGLLLAGLTAVPAQASNLQSVCNSPSSNTYVVPAFRYADGSYYVSKSQVWPGHCLGFYNGKGYGGQAGGRIFITSYAGWYQQGRDGIGWDDKVYTTPKFSNPHNDPPNQINRYRVGI